MTKFSHIEIFKGDWLSGGIHPKEIKKTGAGSINAPKEIRIVFKADMKDIVELEVDGIDAMIAELQEVKEKMREMDLEVHPPEPEPEPEVPVEPPVEETPTP